MDRRTLLQTAVGALASSAIPLPARAAGTSPGQGGPPASRARRWRVLDGLGGFEDRDATEDGWTPEAFQDLRASWLVAFNQTVGHVFGAGDPFERTVRDIARYQQAIHAHPEALRPVRSSRDLQACLKDRRVGVILGFQNTWMLGDQVDRVGLFANLGVKVIQLTYNDRNDVGDGSMAAENRGLTPFGREVVAELNRNRTLVDLSHSGERTCLEAIAASRSPATISHAGCRALCDRPRNKTDQELRALADRGGVIGIYFMPYLREDSRPTAEDVARHIEHAWKVCGEDHVAIGSDGSTSRIRDLEAMREAVSEDVRRRQAAGVSAPGEIPGVLPLVEELTGPEQFRRLVRLLERRGHSAARIDKLMAGNLLRLYAETWGD